MADTRKWEDRGVKFSEESVKSGGDTIPGAQILVVTDLDKFVAAVRAAGKSPEDVLNGSSSPRVTTQATKRRNPKLSGEELRDRAWADVIGTTPPAVERTVYVEKIVEKRVLFLANGKAWDGEGGRIGFMQANVAVLTAMGVPIKGAQAAATAAADEAGLTEEAPKTQA